MTERGENGQLEGGELPPFFMGSENSENSRAGARV